MNLAEHKMCHFFVTHCIYGQLAGAHISLQYSKSYIYNIMRAIIQHIMLRHITIAFRDNISHQGSTDQVPTKFEDQVQSLDQS